MAGAVISGVTANARASPLTRFPNNNTEFKEIKHWEMFGAFFLVDDVHLREEE